MHRLKLIFPVQSLCLQHQQPGSQACPKAIAPPGSRTTCRRAIMGARSDQSNTQFLAPHALGLPAASLCFAPHTDPGTEESWQRILALLEEPALSTCEYYTNALLLAPLQKMLFLNGWRVWVTPMSGLGGVWTWNSTVSCELRLSVAVNGHLHKSLYMLKPDGENMASHQAPCPRNVGPHFRCAHQHRPQA